MERSTPKAKIVPTVVDCLGKSVLAADNTFPTEEKYATVVTRRLAGLHQPETVLMTDQIQEFVAAAEKLKFTQV
jgi:hypothetical protein